MPNPVPAQAPTTVAVVVTFRPDVARLTESLQAVLPQVDRVVVVDNGSPDGVLDHLAGLDRVSVLPLGSNLGIARAQNRGIEWARGQHAGFVLLLDQDSVAAPDMVARLREAHAELSAQGVPVGALGPMQADATGTAHPRFTRFQRGRYLQVEAPPGARSVPCDMLIASGTLVSLEVLDQVGAMNEGLFIDKVDTEWCLRLQRGGRTLHGVPGALLHHRLGESTLTVAWWRGKRLPVHKPFRYYFMVRNSVLLQRMSGMPWRWRWADLSQVLQIIVFHGWMAPGAAANRPMILRGLRDGLWGLTGAMPEA